MDFTLMGNGYREGFDSTHELRFGCEEWADFRFRSNYSRIKGEQYHPGKFVETSGPLTCFVPILRSADTFQTFAVERRLTEVLYGNPSEG
jgi:hypothetical protein